MSNIAWRRSRQIVGATLLASVFLVHGYMGIEWCIRPLSMERVSKQANIMVYLRYYLKFSLRYFETPRKSSASIVSWFKFRRPHSKQAPPKHKALAPRTMLMELFFFLQMLCRPLSYRTMLTHWATAYYRSGVWGVVLVKYKFWYVCATLTPHTSF